MNKIQNLNQMTKQEPMTKTHFVIILQTHSAGNNPAVIKKERYCGVSKQQVMLTCVNSLIKSINYAANKIPEIQFTLKVFDDHSDDESFNQLTEIVGKAHFHFHIESLEEKGLMNSILKCYQYGLNNGKELVYFVQDDYLFYETAIYDMCFAFNDFSVALKQYVGIFPYDDPYRYQPHNTDEMLRMVHGRTRHWRTILHTPCCFMVHHSVLKQNWDLFHKMATSEISGTMEDDSINKLWIERKYFCFSPVPSLALHMGYEAEKDPYIDWQKLWKENSIKSSFILPTDKKILLNIGCGPKSASNNIPFFSNEYNEIRIDIDEKVNPDIIATMNDLSMFKHQSIDAIWSSHALEHIHWHESIIALREFKRVLKEDGILYLLLPNSRYVGQFLYNDQLNHVCYDSGVGPITPVDILYGHRGLIEHKSIYMSHKNCYTSKTIESDLILVGFENILVEEDKYNLKVVATKDVSINLKEKMLVY